MIRSPSITVLLCLLILASFLLEFWPLSLIAVAALAFIGRGVAALIAAFMIDLAFGVPVGFAAYLYFPYTLLVLGIIAFRYSTGHYFAEHASHEYL